MKKICIGLLLSVAFFVVPFFCVTRTNNVYAATESEIENGEIIEKTEDSKFFEEKVLPLVIQIGTIIVSVAGVMTSFLSAINKAKKNFVETAEANIVSAKESKALKKELENATKALEDATKLIKEQHEIIKLAAMNTPALIANGTAKKIKEVVGYEEREKTAQADE